MSEEIISQEMMEMETAQQGISLFDDKKLAKNQKFIKDVLAWLTYKDEHWVERQVTPELLIEQLYFDSTNVMLMNNQWDIYPDYKARAGLKRKLLEDIGVIKPKQPEVRINFLSLLFNGNR